MTNLFWWLGIIEGYFELGIAFSVLCGLFAVLFRLFKEWKNEKK